MLRTGPYGDRFGADPDGISLDHLEAHPHGVDLGPLTPQIPRALRTTSGTIELAPEPVVDDLSRLLDDLAASDHDGLVLVGRRHLRSNNSWMHNVRVLVKGRDRCTLQMHPSDAEPVGLVDGGLARVTSRVGQVEAPVEITEEIRPGVVSLPHGWGHSYPGTRLSVARERAGVNSNTLTDGSRLDALSGNAVLNAIPVSVEPA
jgi:anaerobic selenocysteine-containing dehydrogenase